MTRQPYSLHSVLGAIDRLRIKGFKKVKTADIIREHNGCFVREKGVPPARSYNARFGKYLKENAPLLRIREVRSGVSIRDDEGGKTTSSEWSISSE